MTKRGVIKVESAFSVLPWYGNKEMLTAVNQCVDAIEQAGLSAEQAIDVPNCLAEAIQRSNQVALSNAKFKAMHFRVEIKDGGYLVTLDP
jgi:hypothetical protein